ncbi:hypothetical protein Dsin_020362 [Dipteronia sinensis]|uniref:Uncharacterized protein n=1 Tax=Dipteronia sinensis TaxID=43782 RepID=A0AAE0A950_9ROSI|nr:hypothetical protein Dsin_020362 [Dipteronia sinensis]
MESTLLEKFSSSMNHLQFDHSLVSDFSVYSNHENNVDGFKHNHNNNNQPPPSTTLLENNPQQNRDSDGDSSDFLSEVNHATLKYISEMLMEEDLEGKTCMLQDCLALQAAEKPFYEVLGQKYPFSPNQTHSCLNQNSENNPDDYCTSSSSSVDSSNNLVDPNWVTSQGTFKSSPTTQTSKIDSPESALVVPNLYREIQPFEQISSQVGGARNSLPSKPQEEAVASTATDGSSRGRKSYQLEDSNYVEQGRSNKHSATSVTESEPSEMFDAVLLCNCEHKESVPCLVHGFTLNKPGEKVQQNGQSKLSGGKKRRGKKKGKKGELVDLCSLLTVCAQAVANYDQRTANDLLKQIRQHSSAIGDGTQRLAHYFAYGLEVRLAGTQTPISTHLSTRASAADVIQAYKVYISSCPFNRMSFFMSNRTILKLSEKATRLHIIDFGIGYGFQWPCFIHRVSQRPGGPPKLRITAIEFPQSGFKPAERVEETGRRLKSYCDRFNVPFEYIAIAQKWQTIRLEDLNIDREEITVVNCMYRMRNLPDDTVVVSSPRDTVLKLIKSINPDIFIHGVINGTHNAPFFLPRFREALFHFSALFDAFDHTVPREDQARMLYEREIYGKDAMNVIACEGIERVERPETYKQWHARNQRIGFRQLSLDRFIYKGVMTLVKSNYHQDFVIDEDGQWMLQGWKGRTYCALSFWKPVHEQ